MIQNVGMTGTRNGMTDVQSRVFNQYLERFFTPGVAFHQGDCQGADAQGARMAKALGYVVVAHPPSNPKYQAHEAYDWTYKPKPYLERDKDIVNESEVMLVAPKGMHEQLRSGTWATYRYAKKHGKHIFIIYPNGSTEEVNG